MEVVLRTRAAGSRLKEHLGKKELGTSMKRALSLLQVKPSQKQEKGKGDLLSLLSHRHGRTSTRTRRKDAITK